MSEQRRLNRPILSWALYDWANSAFTMTVMSVFFPIFLKKYWASDMAASDSTFYLGIANALGSIFVVLMAPILGAIADRGGVRKRFLLMFATLGITMTIGLFFVAQGEWQWAVLLYVLASVGFIGANTFYDSLIVTVTTEKYMSFVSSLGYALGYIGSALLFCVHILMTKHPEWFALSDASQAIRVAFVSVGIWWAVFTLPLIFWVHEDKVHGGIARAVQEGLRQFVDTFREIRRYKVVFTFLLAYWCYIDGVDTVVRMAVDYGLSIGFAQDHLIVALLITQFIGFPAAIVFGLMGDRFGEKLGIYIAILVYIAVTLWAYFMDQVIEFYALAAVVGLVQGGIQALSRAYFTKLIPKDKAAEFFGFYNFMGKFAAVLGPLIMAVVSKATGSPRLSILSIIILFIVGGLLLTRVRSDTVKAQS